MAFWTDRELWFVMRKDPRTEGVISRRIMLPLLFVACSFAGPAVPRCVGVAVAQRCPGGVASESAVDRHLRLTRAKAKLEDAVQAEKFSDAARLRDIISSLQLDEEVATLSLHTHLARADVPSSSHPSFTPSPLLHRWQS